MNTTQQPRLARWLLSRLACGEKRESLIGDLDEQFARGRSSLWWCLPVWWRLSPLGPARFNVPIRIWLAVVLVGMPTCTLLGGFWGADEVSVQALAR